MESPLVGLKRERRRSIRLGREDSGLFIYGNRIEEKKGNALK
jgi:hypothetical protein